MLGQDTELALQLRDSVKILGYLCTALLELFVTQVNYGRRPLRSNAVTPDIIVGPIWLHDEQPSSIEIIELNSSNEVEGTPRERKETNHDNGNASTWGYLNNNGIEQIDDSFKINGDTRERRLQDENYLAALASTFATIDNDSSSNFANDYYTNYSTNHVSDDLKFNHQMNCFSIFNKHFIDSNSESTTDGEYGEVEIITSSDLILDGAKWEPDKNDLYNEEIVTYGTELDQETRTIWIYSYKNKHLISDEEFKDNDPNNEMLSSNTSQSTDSSGEHTADKSTSFCRLGSPTPPTCIPRLDLSLVPTLSTVTEISERNTQPTPKESNKSINRNIQKPANNWFLSESAKLEGVKTIRKQERSTNIINWMGLSPRERRRVLKDKTSSDRWIGSRLNLADNNVDDHGDQKIQEVKQNDSIKVLVDAEVHADANDKSDTMNISEPKRKRPSAKSKAPDIPTVHEIKYADAVCEEFQKDRGDHSVKLVVAPAIRLSPKKRKSPEITDPIETLESSNWIRETRDERVTNVYDYVLDAPESTSDDRRPSTQRRDSAADRLWMRNSISFLKPSQWTEFATITESPVSYHLSLGSIVEERQTWYKRILNFLNCCK